MFLEWSIRQGKVLLFHPKKKRRKGKMLLLYLKKKIDKENFFDF